MLSRFRIALASALIMAVSISISVSAKGGFAFITISGADLKETVRAANSELTHDFFAFADFYQNKAAAPADPGIGYEITRYYVDNSLEVAFDKLHYYPETGFVFYDGMVSGSSEYDGKWYKARPEIKAVFVSALPSVALSSSEKPVQQAKIESSTQQTKSSEPMIWPQFLLLVAVSASLAAGTLLFIFARRRRLAP